MGKRINQCNSISTKKHNKIQKFTKMPTLIKTKLKQSSPLKIPINKQGLYKWLRQAKEINKIKSQANKTDDASKLSANLKRILTKQHLLCSICLEVMINPYITICGHYYCQTCLQSSLQFNKRCSNCRQPLNSAHVKKSLIAQTIICELYLNNISINEQLHYQIRKEQQILKRVTIQDLSTLQIIDFYQNRWKSGIIIKINKYDQLYTIVLLQTKHLQLSQHVFHLTKFRFSSLEDKKIKDKELNISLFLQQNRLENMKMTTLIRMYWQSIQKYKKYNNQVSRYVQYLAVRQNRQKLLKQLKIIRFFVFLDDSDSSEDDESSCQTVFITNWDNMSSKWSKWILHQLLRYQGESFCQNSINQHQKQEKQNVAHLQNQIRSLTLQEKVQIEQQQFKQSDVENDEVFEFQEQNISIPFPQYQSPNSLNNQPESNEQYIQQEIQFFQLSHIE